MYGLRTPKQLVAAQEFDLAFNGSGTLVELSIEVGDHVEEGQVVARLDNTNAKNQLAQAEFDLEQAEQILANLNSTSAFAEAQLNAVNKQRISSMLVVLWLIKVHADSGLFSWSISFYSMHHKVRLY